MVEVTINQAKYVKDHYEIWCDVDGVDYQLQVISPFGIQETELKARINGAWSLKTTGINVNNIQIVPAPAVPTEPTPEQQAIIDKTTEMEVAKKLKDTYSQDLDTAYFYLEKMNSVDSSTDVPVSTEVLSISKTNIGVYIEDKLSKFNTAYTDYVTKKAELDALING